MPEISSGGRLFNRSWIEDIDFQGEAVQSSINPGAGDCDEDRPG